VSVKSENVQDALVEAAKHIPPHNIEASLKQETIQAGLEAAVKHLPRPVINVSVDEAAMRIIADEAVTRAIENGAAQLRMTQSVSQDEVNELQNEKDDLEAKRDKLKGYLRRMFISRGGHDSDLIGKSIQNESDLDDLERAFDEAFSKSPSKDFRLPIV